SVAAPDRQGRLCFWDVGTGEQQRSLGGAGRFAHHFCLSADGTLAAIAGRGAGTAVSLTDAKGPRKTALEGVDPTISALALSADGKLLAAAGITKKIGLWDTTTGKRLHLLKGHQYFIVALAFSPDGKVLASHSMDGIVHLWETASGAEQHRCADNQPSADPHIIQPEGNSLDFTRDGMTRAMADRDGRLRLCNVASDKGKWTLMIVGGVSSVAL